VVGVSNAVAWAGLPSTLLAADSLPARTTDGNIYILAVDGSGVTPAGQFAGRGGGGRMYYLDGLVYNDSGIIADPSVQSGSAVVATCAPPSTLFSGRAEALDPASGRVFQLASYFNEVEMDSYSTRTCQPVARAPIGTVTLDPYGVPHLVRWGSNGLAFLTTDGRLITLTGAFVGP
jgi:hypothetical protein